jgi:hypothetical protein
VTLVNHPETIEITLKDSRKLPIFNVYLDKQPQKVSFNNLELSDSKDYTFDPQKHKLVVRLPEIKDGVLTITK